jgi:hypothetical protein
MTTDDPMTKTIDIAKTTESKWSSKYNDENADVELISSDGWHFKVHSYRLQFISSVFFFISPKQCSSLLMNTRPVFRSMISMATSTTQQNPVTFTDDKFEVGIVIRLFLDAVYTGVVDDFANTDNVNSTMYVIDFARTWECQWLLNAVERCVDFNLSKLDETECPDYDNFDLFRIAVKLERYELAGACIRAKSGLVWNDEIKTLSSDTLSPNFTSAQPVRALSDLQPIEGASVFDLSAGPCTILLELPPNVAWALLRSNHIANTKDNGNSIEGNHADEFVKIMRLACESAFTGVHSADGRSTHIR